MDERQKRARFNRNVRKTIRIGSLFAYLTFVVLMIYSDEGGNATMVTVYMVFALAFGFLFAATFHKEMEKRGHE